MNIRHIVLLLVLILETNAQDQRLLEQRLTDKARKFTTARFLSATRYVPIMIARGLGTWSSPHEALEINGMPYQGFPLNLVSPDYAPIDLILVDSVTLIQRPVLTEGGRFPGGVFSVRTTQVPDSLSVAGRVYGGSETGDVILQEYTQKNLPFFNRNKIGFSGAATASDRTGGLGYRLTGGGFTYFSVGYAERDKILIPYIDLPTFSRPNRHFLGSLELDYPYGGDAAISVYGGLNSFESWEHMPFLPTFALFSGTTGTLRLSAVSVLPFLDLFARRDMVSLTMHKQLGTDGGEYESSVSAVTLIPGFSVGEYVHVRVPVEYDVHSVNVPDQNRQLFASDIQRSTWSAALELEVQAGHLQGSAHGRIEKGLHGGTLQSATLGTSFSPAEHQVLEIHASSIERTPTLLELYGAFSSWRFRPATGVNDTFRIAGNADLRSERTSGIELNYSLGMNPRMTTAVFANRTENLIGRQQSNVIRTFMPGDLVFSGNYGNRPAQTISGLEFLVEVGVSELVNMEARYAFTENSMVPETPRHQFSTRGTMSFTTGTTAEIIITGSSMTIWKEFSIAPADDDKNGSGTDGVVPQYWSVDCSVAQSLGRMFFLKEVTGRIELQNLLNRRLRTFPLGVAHDLAVIGYLSFRI